MSERIAGWIIAPLEVVTSHVGSGSTPKGGEAAYKVRGIPLVRSMNVVFFGFKRQGLAYIDEAQAAAIGNAVVQHGDVLLNITGASIGRVTRAPADMAGARVNQHVCIVRPLPAMDARFLQAFLSSPEMQQQIHADNYGVTRQALTKQQILGFQVPIPPEAEQRRIADKLDTVLARVDGVKDRLDRVAPLLKRFRQSVLAAATAGRLRDPEHAIDTDQLADPTCGWRKERLSQIAHRVSVGHVGLTSEHYTSADIGVPLLRSQNVRPGRMSADGLAHITRDFNHALKKSQLQAGDLLVVRVGANRGDACIVPIDHKGDLNCANVVFARPDVDIIDPRYLEIYFQSPACQDSLLSASVGGAQGVINTSVVGSVEVPFPPLVEQAEIVRRVELLFGYADRLEARLQAAQTAADRLTPALLAKAFRGELVPQDPNDEPASELLKRLTNQRGQAAANVRGRKPRARA